MKKTILLMYLLSLAFAVLAQTEPASHHIAIKKFQQYYNNDHPDSLYNILSPDFREAFPVLKLRALINQLQQQFGTLEEVSFLNGTPEESTYKALFHKSRVNLRLSLTEDMHIKKFLLEEYKPEAHPPDTSIAELPIEVRTLSGILSGTITMPKNIDSKIPVVLIIAGSGPVDRNGNIISQNMQPYTYMYIADSLCRAGIAAVRYDKRGIGKSLSNKKEAQVRFEDFVDDATAFIKVLKRDGRFSKVIVLGHSEGSLIGMLAVRNEKGMTFISVAGPGDPIDKILTEQLKKQPPYIIENFKGIIDSLKKGKVNNNVDPGLYNVARPDIQGYLASWMRYNPQVEINKLKCPVLIIQGTTDIQVGVVDAEKLKKAKPNASFEIIEGMNHILKPAPNNLQQNLATYHTDSALHPQFMKYIISFIKSLEISN